MLLDSGRYLGPPAGGSVKACRAGFAGMALLVRFHRCGLLFGVTCLSVFTRRARPNKFRRLCLYCIEHPIICLRHQAQVVQLPEHLECQLSCYKLFVALGHDYPYPPIDRVVVTQCVEDARHPTCVYHARFFKIPPYRISGSLIQRSFSLHR